MGKIKGDSMTMKFISIEEIFGLFTPSQRKEVLKVLKERIKGKIENLKKKLRKRNYKGYVEFWRVKFW